MNRASKLVLKKNTFLNVVAKLMSTDQNEIIFQNVGDKGVIILNRPKHLNTLTNNMFRAFETALKEWEPRKTLVIIKGAGDKAFCTGGDLKLITDYSAAKHFAEWNYPLTLFINSYKVPYIALVDGMVMGAGAGISMHGKYRVATERTQFAMPETHIGLYPDFGGSYFLPRLPGKLGWYLALTGYRIEGSDVATAGLATHYCESKKLEELEEALLKCSNTEDIEITLARFDTAHKEFSLEKDGSKWAEGAAKSLLSASPTSSKIILKQLALGKHLTLQQCVQMEYVLAYHRTKEWDFYEGIRAVVVTKDRKPKVETIHVSRSFRRMTIKLLTSKLARKTNILQIVRRMSTDENDVIIQNVGDKGILILNRPKALNALNLSMVKKIYPILKNWETEKTLVIVKGSGDKAFCAGGDVRAVVVSGLKGDKKLGQEFFRNEYMTNGLIGSYKIPYIAFTDGIVMGGGVGISIHGQYRIATERTLFAMPETQIGLFPDVGGSYFLPRLSGRLGWYLALTGHRLKGADVVKAGIATHYCETNKLKDLELSLLNCSNDQDVKTVLGKYEVDNAEFSLSPLLDKINECFSATTVEEVLTKLERDGSKWADETRSVLLNMSPTSLKVTFRELELGKQLSLPECLQMEYRLAVNCLENKDFYEGVRALLIDKDQKPKWDPPSLSQVSAELVESHFSKIKIISLENGRCTAELKVSEEHANSLGSLHGGLSATIVDSISTYALMSHKNGEVASVSVDIHMTYLKGAKVGDEIEIDANTIRAGRTLAFLEVFIKNKSTGEILVKGSHTKFLMQNK
ncbi:hypothetical protein NQ317_013753 [Molorchus minor]|uniref:3-hydroxyisobutyryl-CoA hydrolase, mitochondrial n=1 Tax=Molorchus minor TaxID=1323400 RepID=A0ABQ9JR56_9CUCU|nr:hypothetical protein NQ317_013753 [Molorchus minor]